MEESDSARSLRYVNLNAVKHKSFPKAFSMSVCFNGY